MNFKTFDVLIVCSGYSKQLDACLFFWDKMNYPKDKYRITISTSNKDKKTLKVISEYKEKINIIVSINRGNNYHNKGQMLYDGYNFIKNNINDFIFMSDADILFEKETLSEINSFLLNYKDNDILISSLREDIYEQDIFFKNYKHNHKETWAWENLNRKIISPSPFMGWFLLFSYIYLDKIDFVKNHKGYDIIDWKIYGQLLSLGLKKKIIYFDNMPLHLFHGTKGSNWSGIDIS